MSFDVQETTKGNDSGSDLSDSGDITATAQRSWTITSTEPGHSAEYVKKLLQQSGALPLESQSHPDNVILGCRSVKVARQSPILFTAQAGYKSNPLPQGSNDTDEVFPWQQPAKVSYRSVTQEVDADEDINGDPIVNPETNEPVEGVKRRVSDVLAIVRRPFLVFSGPTIINFMDKVNDDSFLGFGAGRGMVQDIEATESRFDQIPYYDVTAQILFRTPYQTSNARAWWHRRILKGFYIVDGSGNIVRAVDDESRPVTRPVFIDSNGERIESGGTPEAYETELNDTVAFSGMGFF